MKIIKKSSIIISGLLALNLLIPSAQALPPAFDATYTVNHGSLKLGNMNSKLNYSGGKYVYKKDSVSTGLASLVSGMKITESSHGNVNGNRFLPKGYTHYQKRRNKEKRTQFQFVTPTKVSGIFKGDRHTFIVPNGTLDRATLELALADGLQRNQQQLRFNLVEQGESKNYNFVKRGIEKITTASGTYTCVKLEVQRTDASRKTLYWMAKELDYLPVKMYHNEKGSVITTTLTKITLRK